MMVNSKIKNVTERIVPLDFEERRFVSESTEHGLRRRVTPLQNDVRQIKLAQIGKHPH